MDYYCIYNVYIRPLYESHIMRVIYMIHNDSIEFETVAKLLGIYKIYKIYKKKQN